LKSSAEEKKFRWKIAMFSRKSRSSAENEIRQPENQNLSRIFGSLAENSKVQLKI